MSEQWTHKPPDECFWQVGTSADSQFGEIDCEIFTEIRKENNDEGTRFALLQLVNGPICQILSLAIQKSARGYAMVRGVSHVGWP